MPYTFAGRYTDRFQNRFGNAIPNLTVYVYEDEAATTLATLYADRYQVSTVPNPTATDASGNLAFFAAPGTYYLVAVDFGIAQPALEVLVPVDPEDAIDLPGGADGGGLPIGGSTGQSLVKASTDDYDVTWATVEGSGSGATDHGALLGLSDNDHPQYALATSIATIDATIVGVQADIDAVAADLVATDADVATLTTDVATVEADLALLAGDAATPLERLDAVDATLTQLDTDKEDAGTAATAVADHAASTAPHPGFMRAARYDSVDLVWKLADGTEFTPEAGITTVFILGVGDAAPVFGTGSGNKQLGDLIISETA